MYAWDSITVHGPTASAERPNRKKTLQQLTNEHNYWKMRWTKWEAQSKPKVHFHYFFAPFCKFFAINRTLKYPFGLTASKQHFLRRGSVVYWLH
jgi:hypothetical protein